MTVSANIFDVLKEFLLLAPDYFDKRAASSIGVHHYIQEAMVYDLKNGDALFRLCTAEGTTDDIIRLQALRADVSGLFSGLAEHFLFRPAEKFTLELFEYLPDPGILIPTTGYALFYQVVNQGLVKEDIHLVDALYSASYMGIRLSGSVVKTTPLPILRSFSTIFLKPPMMPL
ncbi:hypothetical protein MKQ70_32365 [Chitinophaga sedimenti]|uniref:hypothetical protein n=1 Tax=Chitinophaga sedimenti TaxID=2033606 RepID=UPI002006B0B1|nr:hypothetical protein [Chitinophaga sedimenti]MCK7559412.1 hypothetical protein [Chitinophaga sedimenti]